MFSTLVTFFSDSSWTQLIDYAVLALVARYAPNMTPYVQGILPKAKAKAKPVAKKK